LVCGEEDQGLCEEAQCVVVVFDDGEVLVPLPGGPRPTVLGGVEEGVINVGGDVCGEVWVRRKAEGRWKRVVVVFEELGEFLKGFAGLSDGGWAFKKP